MNPHHSTDPPDEGLSRAAAPERALRQAVVQLNAHILGGVAGVLAGALLLIATLVLVLKGGPHPGPHLALLGQYFPGYSVTVGGAFLGFAYAFVVGYAAGFAVGVLYNRIVSSTDPRD